jgi:ATP-dependent RNA helicase TDRD9
VGALTLNVGDRYSKYDGDLTHMGRVMARLPIDIRFGRLIMLGLVYGVAEETIIIGNNTVTIDEYCFKN